MNAALRILGMSVCILAAASVFGSAEAKTDQEKATKACRKEMNWSELRGKVKKSPTMIAELDACVKRKMAQ